MLLPVVLVALMAAASLFGPLLAGVVMLAFQFVLDAALGGINFAFVLKGWLATCDGGGSSAARNHGPTQQPIAGFEARFHPAYAATSGLLSRPRC